MTVPTGRDRWTVRPRPLENPRLRLFCFPHSGGGAAQYTRWPADLPPDIEVCAVQLPGREQRVSEAPFSHMAPLVEELLRVLAPYFEAPFAFFGHSLGGFISFDLARALRRQGRTGPLHLFVAGSRAPQLPSRLPDLHHLPDPEFIDGLRRYEGTPDEALQNADLMRLLLPMLRADFSLTETNDYVQEPPFDVPISVFGGLDDPVVERFELTAWREHTTRALTLRMLPGDHFFVQSARSLLLSALVEDLEESAPLMAAP
ncbi:MAG: thioesterase [Chloroflexi bacterium]|nr:thioesterase [Chloroflexota bacterium]